MLLNDYFLKLATISSNSLFYLLIEIFIVCLVVKKLLILYTLTSLAESVQIDAPSPRAKQGILTVPVLNLDLVCFFGQFINKHTAASVTLSGSLTLLD